MREFKRTFFDAIICVFLFSTFMLAGCYVFEPLPKPRNSRFEVIHYEDIQNGHIRIYLDKKTREKYVFIKDGYGAGLAKLEEKE